MKRAVTCRCHCSSCGAHFSSLAAFDAHRGGRHHDGTRHCLDPSEIAELRTVARSAVCRLSGGGALGAVTVWQLAADVERVHAHFRSVVSASRASSAHPTGDAVTGPAGVYGFIPEDRASGLEVA